MNTIIKYKGDREERNTVCVTKKKYRFDDTIFNEMNFKTLDWKKIPFFLNEALKFTLDVYIFKF